MEGETSTEQSAHELGKLCENLDNLVVNLIPYNKTNVKDKLSCPSEEHLQLFQKIVSSYGVFCTIQRTMDADIAGACGQLVIEKETKKNNKNQQNPLILKMDHSPIIVQKLQSTKMVMLSKIQSETKEMIQIMTKQMRKIKSKI